MNLHIPHCVPCYERLRKLVPVFRLDMCQGCFSGKPTSPGPEEEIGDEDQKLTAYKRRYYQKNRKKVAACQRRYCQKNREKVAAYQRSYRQKHREKLAAKKLEAKS